MATTIPTEPIGSVPRPGYLIEAMGAHAAGGLDDAGLGQAMGRAVAETVAAMEATGSPVITDGEQSKPSFATYPLAGLDTLAPDGVVIPFEDGHTRQLPVLTAGPFRYTTYSGGYAHFRERAKGGAAGRLQDRCYRGHGGGYLPHTQALHLTDDAPRTCIDFLGQVADTRTDRLDVGATLATIESGLVIDCGSQLRLHPSVPAGTRSARRRNTLSIAAGAVAQSVSASGTGRPGRTHRWRLTLSGNGRSRV